MAEQPNKPKSKVYIETTIVSYLTAWPSRDVVRLSHQMITREWWEIERPNFDVFTSELVIKEVSAGDPTAASERLMALSGIPLLAITPDGLDLAERLAAALSLPDRARADAAHVAIAAINGIEFLLTWNCKHLANGILLPKIEQTCMAHGFQPPRILTPEQLTE